MNHRFFNSLSIKLSKNLRSTEKYDETGTVAAVLHLRKLKGEVRTNLPSLSR
jgi:hypothetical protein